MPKIPYKSEKSRNNSDEDYEIVSFEDFCDKSPGPKADLLTLNDNINYRLCFESDKSSKYFEKEGETSKDYDQQSETSLGPTKAEGYKTVEFSFTPFARKRPQKEARTLFTGVNPNTGDEGESSSRWHRYQRFSEHRNIFQRMWECMPGFGSGILVFALICALCVGVWWAVSGAVGGAWGEEHYRRLWERAHPDTIKNPVVPTSNQWPIFTEYEHRPEHRFHDHNNLSTKNKLNATEQRKKLDTKKSSYSERPMDVLKDMCARVADDMRFDCFPQNGANENDCIKRGCCWKPTKSDRGPYCFYPPQYDTFRFVNMTETKHGMSVYYEKQRPSGYPDDFDMARLDFKYLSDDVLQIKIYDAEHNRFEPPFPSIPEVPGPISHLKYRVQLESSTIGFKVIRNEDNITIINTQDIGGLILSDKMLQLSAILPTNHLFGLGEKRDRFMLDINWRTYTMFNYDCAPKENTNLYGTHPFYLAVEPNGKSHGMLILNSNAMDVVLQPTPALTVRAVGGVLNLLVMSGPSPDAVGAQYATLVGRPFMPPYWALGFHLCKYNYGSLNVTREVWKKNRDAGIPFDVQWNDIDYMNNSNDFTYDTEKYAGLPEFVQELHNEGMHYVILIDPGISASEKSGEYLPYDRGIQMDIFVKNSTNQPFVGKTWNKVSTVYPDFTHPSSTKYWVDMMTLFHNKIPFDGAWIDMNEPSNFLSGPLEGACSPEELPYTPHVDGQLGLRTKTLCMDARHYRGPHSDWHNLYGLTEAMATHFALMEIRGKRPFIISRSSFVGLGQYAGHWSGDVSSTWHDLQMTVPELLSFSLFGVPMMGADICGFNGNTSVELCKRWMQLGAFYPFSRNHNSDSSSPQDPVSMGPEVVAASRAALRTRYRLLPVYYTLFWRAHVAGEMVVRPLFFEAPHLERLYTVDDQFMIGSYLLISPILDPDTSSTKAFFPPSQKWYDFADGQYITTNSWSKVSENNTVSVKGGGILPLQEPPARGPVTTAATRSQPLQLLVVPDDATAAQGELYWDDGDSLNSYEEKKYSHIEFNLKHNELRSSIRWWGYGVPSVNNITILAQTYPIKMVTINDVPCQKPCEFNNMNKMLQISHINLSLDKPFIVKWTYKHMVQKQLHNKTVNNTFECKNKDCSMHD